MFHEEWDILLVFAKRRELDLDHVQTIVEVFPELPRRDQGGEVLVRGSQYPNVHGLLPIAAHGPDRPLLENPEQLDLKALIQLAHFVQEDGAPLGLSKQPGPVPIRSGERPSHVTEEFGLQQARRQSATVYREKWLGCTPAALVDSPGHEFLARAGLAHDEDGAPGRRHAIDEVEDPTHGLRAAHQARKARRGRQALLQLDIFLGEPVALQRPFADQQELVDTEGLLDVVIGPGLHGIDGRIVGGVSRHHDHLRLGSHLLDATEEFQPGQPVHAQVRDDEFEGWALLEILECLGAPTRGHDLKARLHQRDLQELAHALLVVHHEDASAMP